METKIIDMMFPAISYFHQFQVSSSRLDICNDWCNKTLFRANFVVFGDQNLNLVQIEKVVQEIIFCLLTPPPFCFWYHVRIVKWIVEIKPAVSQRSPGVAEARLLPPRGRMHSTNY